MRRSGHAVPAGGDRAGYAGFISYSHAIDSKLAPALQDALERFGKPWYRQRARRLFRDNANLAASPQLWDAIAAALQDSRWFILLASPSAAASTWVRREVAWWVTHRGVDRILIALTDGELSWDAGTGRADPGPAPALPPELLGAMAGEPRWVDLRWIGSQDHIDQDNPRFRDCVADIAAAISEVPKDSLVGEHVRRHRQTVRLVRGVIATLSVLLVAAIAAGLIAYVQRNVARTNQRIATARQLVAEAEATRDSDPRTALRLGIAAQHISRSPETQSSLVKTMTSSRYLRTLSDRGPVTSLAFSHDGNAVVTGSDEVTLWDLSGRLQPRRLDQPDVDSMALAPDGRTVAVVSGSALVLWDLADPARPRRLGASLPADVGLPSVMFSPDGRTMATGSAGDPAVVLWDLTDRLRPRRLSRFESSSAGARSMAFAPDGRTLAVAGEKVALWDVTGRTRPRLLGRPLALHRGLVESVAFSPDGRQLATGGNDWTVTVWDVSRRAAPVATQRLTDFRNTVWSLAFAPGGRMLAVASDRVVSLWDLSDPDETAEFDVPLAVHTGRVAAMAFAPDGHMLATGSDDRTVTLWDMSEQYQPRRLGRPVAGRSGPVTSMAFADGGRMLAAGGADGMIVLFDVSDPAEPRRIGRPLEGHSTWVRTLAVAPDGRTLASTDLSGEMILWDLADPAAPRRFDRLAPPGDRTLAVSIAADGRTLAAGGDGVVVLWDLTDHARPRSVASLRTGHGEVDALAFAPDDRSLAVGNGDKSVVVLDLSAADRGRVLGRPLAGYDYEVDWVSFAADGNTLASGDKGGGTAIWDVTDRANPRRLVSPVGQEPQADVVAFEPLTRTLAIAESNDNVPRSMTLWDLTDPVQARRLGHPLTGQVVAAGSGAFSPDGRVLATADFDGAFTLWDLTRLSGLRSDPVPAACARAGGSLDRDQWSRYVSNLDYEDGCAG